MRARIQFKVLTLVFKCLHGNAPAYLSELIKQYQPSPQSSNTVNKIFSLKIHVKSKTFGDRAFEKNGTKNYGITSPKTSDPSQTLINFNPC